MLRKLMVGLAVLLIALATVRPAAAVKDPSVYPFAVYIMTNDSANNQVIAYQRAEDGSLSYSGTFDTGGQGSGVGITVPPDPLGSQNSLLVSPDGRWVFAVNAGSNELSVFAAMPDGLVLTDKVSSGGNYPVSVTLHDNLVYVLNAADEGSIQGYQFENGHLMPLADSNRSLFAATPADGSQPHILESPGQVGFSPDGQYLVITDKGGVSGVGKLLVFHVGADGLPAADFTTFITDTPVPFAFTFDRYDHLVVVDASAGSITSYAIESDATLSFLDQVVNGQAAVCWIDANHKYIFTDNTGSGTVSAVKPHADGSLTLLNAVAADTGSDSLPLDMGISKNGKFLYTLNVGDGTIGIFAIRPDGSLASLGSIDGLPSVGGYQGIAVH